MKKLIAILVVMIVLVGAVFADNGTVNTGTQRITLKTDVEERLPNFLLQGSLTSYEAALVDANTGDALAGTALESDKSIADYDITAYFIIKQNASKKYSDGTASAYARTQKSITFTFAIGNLTQQGVAQNPKVIAGALVAQSAVAAAAGTYTVDETQYTNLITNTVNGQVFTAKYNGRVENGQEIGRFTAKWNKDITAPNGVYKADITVEIAVQ